MTYFIPIEENKAKDETGSTESEGDTDEEERDPEKAECTKVAKFYEMVHDKKVVGVPVRAISEQDYKYTKEFQIVESWPLIQAYGLDSRFNSV